MSHNLIIDEINSVQKRYQYLLLDLLPYLNVSNPLEILVEINIFWLKHMDTVRLYLETVPKNDTYVFTAVVRLDFQDNEHLPFLLFCEKAILDDPLSKYCEICKGLPKGKHQKDLQNQIYITLTDNLKVLTHLNNSLLILPFRLLNQSALQQSNDQSSLIDYGQKLFVHLFNDIENMQDYFEKCSNLCDIKKHLRKDAEKFLKLTEYDDQNLPFETRFKNAISQTKYFVDSSNSDAINFFRLVYGNIQQAVDVVYSCELYRCIPYIRYSLAFYYVSWLMQNMFTKEQFLAKYYKMRIPLISHYYSDKEKLSSVTIDKFLKKKRSYNFSETIYKKLKVSGINEQNFNTNSSTIPLVKAELDSFYNFLSSN